MLGWRVFVAAAVAAATVCAKQAPFVLPEEAAAPEFSVMQHPVLPAHSLRVHRPPGSLCERKNGTVSLSGYLDVDLDKLLEQDDASGAESVYPAEVRALRGHGVVEHFYFWAFESRSQPATDPVTLWLNGGPGCSSFTGLLMELGPCNAAPPKDGAGRTRWNPHAWSSNSTVVFLDQPVGVGFSYASWKNTSRPGSPPSRIFDTPGAARDVSAFLHLLSLHQGRSGMSRKFHMAGESYAGRYLPLFASQLLRDNEHYERFPEHGLRPVPLESILIGNGITSPMVQNPAFIDYACTDASGKGPFLDEHTCDRMRAKWPVCRRLLEQCNEQRGNVPYSRLRCQSATTFCAGALQSPWDKTNSSYYDYLHKPDYDEEEWVSVFLNDPHTRKHLGVDSRGPGDKHDGTFVGCSDQVYYDFDQTGDGARDSTWAVEEVLRKGVRVLSYSGKRDFICNFIGNGRWTLDLDWPGRDAFRAAPLEPWFVQGRDSPAGYFRHHANLTYAIVEDAGHFVPLDQPVAALEMLRRWELGSHKGRLDTL